MTEQHLDKKKDRRPIRNRPPASERKYFIVSVDDHLIEPPDIFQGRLSSKFADQAPSVRTADDGIEYWDLEGQLLPKVGPDVEQSWDFEHWTLGPVNYDEIIEGSWDPHERVKDMDIAGIAAQVVFPSTVFGFAGRRFNQMEDDQLGLALVRAYNDWLIEEWAASYPDRLFPCQIAWMLDPEQGAKEIRRNAERGFRAVTFVENPQDIGLDSLYSRTWDPIFSACQETGTVVNLHVGASTGIQLPSKESPIEMVSALFPVHGYAIAIDWLFSGIPSRFADLKIVMTEGGISWVPQVFSFFDYNMTRWSTNHGIFKGWEHGGSPIETFRRNFWFTNLYDPPTLELRHLIGIENILFETDYPHSDSTWPNCQSFIDAQVRGWSQHEIDAVTNENAARLYGLDLTRLRAALAA